MFYIIAASDEWVRVSSLREGLELLVTEAKSAKQLVFLGPGQPEWNILFVAKTHYEITSDVVGQVILYDGVRRATVEKILGRLGFIKYSGREKIGLEVWTKKK